MIRLGYQRTNDKKEKVEEYKDFDTTDVSWAFQMLRDYCFKHQYRLIPDTVHRILPKDDSCL